MPRTCAMKVRFFFHPPLYSLFFQQGPDIEGGAQCSHDARLPAVTAECLLSGEKPAAPPGLYMWRFGVSTNPGKAVLSNFSTVRSVFPKSVVSACAVSSKTLASCKRKDEPHKYMCVFREIRLCVNGA